MLVDGAYITSPKQFKLWKAPSVISSIVVVGTLTRCALLHFVCNLTLSRMNVQRYALRVRTRLYHGSKQKYLLHESVVYWPNLPFQRRWKLHILLASYGKRLRRRAWLTIWDKVKIPLCSHKLMHRKRVTCELHDSYFRLMILFTQPLRSDRIWHKVNF